MSQPPETESKSAFARRLGVSKARVSQLIKAGLPVKPDGSIDIAEGLAWVAAHLDHSRRIGAKAAKRNGSAEPAPDFDGDSETPEDEPISFFDARAKHESAKARLAEVRLQKVRGELVERDRATALVFRLAREERDAWVNWPARVAALMAAELGVDTAAMQKVLEAYVREHLGELAEIDIAL